MRIDPHVHFRDEEQAYKGTIAHELSVAEKQSVSYVFDMPNTRRPILNESDIKRRLALVPKKYKGKYFCYIGATADEDQLKEAINLIKKIKEAIGIKLFAGKSTGDLAIIDEEKQLFIYKTLAKNNYTGVIAVHCEKESYMKDEFDPNNPYTHALSRPNIAEIESIKDQIKFVKESNFKGTLHICHVSCKDSIQLIEEARKHIKITCGITPHHLMWTDEKLKGSHGLLYKMNPPLRSKEDVKALQEYIKQGKIDWIETDHAPHALGEKLHDKFPSGYPSLYIYKECVESFLPKLGLNKKQIDDLTYNNIIKTFEVDLDGIK